MEAIASRPEGFLPSGLKVGSRLASYEVTSLLSAAGISAVYRARHVVTGDEVALKVLPSELAADDTQRLRFMREAQLARALVHPAIVRIRDVGETSRGSTSRWNMWPVATLAGSSPSAVRSRRRKVVSMLTPVAEALDAAHAAGHHPS